MKLEFNKRDLEDTILTYQILNFDVEKSYAGVDLEEVSVLELKNYVKKNPNFISSDKLRDYFLNMDDRKLIISMYEVFPEIFDGEKKNLVELYLGSNFNLPKYVLIK